MTTREPDFLNYLKTGDMALVGDYDIPKVKGVKLKNLSKANLIGFNYATNPNNMSKRSDDMVHFFLPDYLIERVWDNLDYYQGVFNQYKAIIQPDFSQYVGMPRAMLIWQHYRRMWLAAYYQRKGITVIPAPCWSDEESFEYCFDGMPKNSCLCISSVGCIQNPDVLNRFMLGFKETLNRLTPAQIILYGNITNSMKELMECPWIHLESEQRRRINTYKRGVHNGR